MKIALKCPISNTSFTNKVPISETYHKNITLTETLKLLCPLTIKWRLFQLLAKFVKNAFFCSIYYNFTNIIYLFLLMYVICSKFLTKVMLILQNENTKKTKSNFRRTIYDKANAFVTSIFRSFMFFWVH